MLAVFRMMVERTLWLRGAIPIPRSGRHPNRGNRTQSAKHARDTIVTTPSCDGGV